LTVTPPAVIAPVITIAFSVVAYEEVVPTPSESALALAIELIAIVSPALAPT